MMTITGVLSLIFVIALCLKSEALASFPNGSAINSSFNKIVLFAATKVSGVVLYDVEKLKTAEKT